MSDYIFLFDLDSTITKAEILPMIAKAIGKEDEIRRITEKTMRGEIPFLQSFLDRVEILSRINVSDVSDMISEIPLNEKMVSFIKKHPDRCFVVTGNIDVWISKLMKRIIDDTHLYCSRADIENGNSIRIVSVADKELVARQFVRPIVAIGDGDNDTGMAKIADISIGFGEVRDIAPSLKQIADKLFYDEKELVAYLETLI